MIALLLFGLTWQSGFDPSKLGIRNPSLDLRRATETRRRTAVERINNARRGDAGSASPRIRSSGATRKWTPFTGAVTVCAEETPYGLSLPKVRWEWYVMSKGKAVAKTAGFVYPSQRTPVELPNLTDQPGFLAWRLDSSGKESGWRIASDTRYTELPSAPPKPYGTTGKRLWTAPRRVVLVRDVIDVELRGFPEQATVSFGDEKFKTVAIGQRTVQIEIPREYSEKGATLLVDDVSPKLRRVATVPLTDIFGPASPYRRFTATLRDDVWDLDGVPSMSIPAARIFDQANTNNLSLSALPSASELTRELGTPTAKRKDTSHKNFGRWDGAEWWVYQKKGVEFKIRTVFLGSGATRDIIEKVALISPNGGDVADLRVGDPESLVVSTLGKGDVFSSLGREDLGFRSYIGGGVAFFANVNTNKIVRIEFRRPLSFLSAGLVPGKLRRDDFARIADIDYRTGEITLELPEGAEVTSSSRFKLFNLDRDAFAQSATGSVTLAEVSQIKDGLAICRLVTGSSGRTRSLNIEDAQVLVRKLLDPGCGFSYGVLTKL